MLTVNDLPSGWQRSRFVSPPGADRLDTAPVLGNLYCANPAGLIGGLQTGFELNSDAPAPDAFEEDILVFSSGEAQGFMTQQRALTSPGHVLCTSFTFAALKIEAFGDESVAYTASHASTSGDGSDTAFVIIRRGDVVTIIGNPLPNSGALSKEAFARLADAKLAKEASKLNASDRCGTPIGRLGDQWTRC
jgi:hypothetical protein